MGEDFAKMREDFAKKLTEVLADIATRHVDEQFGEGTIAGMEKNFKKIKEEVSALAWICGHDGPWLFRGEGEDFTIQVKLPPRAVHLLGVLREVDSSFPTAIILELLKMGVSYECHLTLARQKAKERMRSKHEEISSL